MKALVMQLTRGRRVRQVLGLVSVIAGAALVTACGGGADDSSAADTAALKVDLKIASDSFIGRDLDALRRSDDAMALSERLFDAYCAGCHGADGTGKKGITDLTRGHFNYGTSAEAISTTIRDGRHSAMPALGREYGEVEIGQLVSYVQILTQGGELENYDERGRQAFAERCAACHGEDGRGQPELGASDLGDEYWQHGDSMMNIRLVITRGVESECPAHGGELTPVEIDLLTAYVQRWVGS